MATHYNIGQVLFAFKGEWSEETAYAALDCVTYDGGTYACKKDAPAGTAPTNTEYWFVMAQKGADGKADNLESGAVVPFYNVTFNEGERHPIFWGKTEPDTKWLICDGGDDLHGGTVPDLRNRFIMGAASADEAGTTGGSTTTEETTLTAEQMPSHRHLTRWSAAGASAPYGGTSSNVSWPPGGTALTAGAYSDNTGGSGSHSHAATPPYYKLVYLVKLPEAEEEK